ncbi:hypothetical protein Klosneuvirus_2_265 [Klosneuvirus KNV1]|uniref:Uncharacterized protein n=1 Tax=Klosneuvirus KNV1 TaxID=1977640 RepID=A0A1V0SJD6_9VIRU|nr:hypothetical protein Klosneuvirus_2_265 [Klosneuvirus KNV1]
MTGLIFIIIVIFILSIIIIFRLEKTEVIYKKSSVDGNEYLVRELPDDYEAADILALLRKNMITLTENLYNNKEKYKDYAQYIDTLNNKIKKVVINESSPNSSYTSYSINKGEQMVFCVRSKTNNRIHDLNLLMYVALHEMSHVASPTYGHDDQFKKVFAFLTTKAVEMKIYNKIEFKSIPTEYCGLIISESII